MTTNTPRETTEAKPAPRTNGMTEERFAEVLAYLRSRKRDPGYFERWEQQVAEVRRQIQEETARAGQGLIT